LQYGNQNNWEGEITGQFDTLDLAAICGEHFPHTLSGTAEVQLKAPARFAGGRLKSLRAAVNARGGTASQAFLQACIEKLGLSPGVGFDVEIARDPIAYQQIKFEMLLDSQGLQINGDCPLKKSDVHVPGAIAIDGNLCLLANPKDQPLPMAALIRTLATPSAAQVPATEQAGWLMRHLPLTKEK
jgi:hypothetical protein